MFDIINKRELFEWWDKGYADKAKWDLKAIQDAWAWSILKDSKGLRIAEVGGGKPRVLAKLAEHNTCINIDKLEGVGQGPKAETAIEGITTIKAYLGDFDPRLEDISFDVIFSLSVLEHVADDDFNRCFADMARILKPGGRMLHAIDVYLDLDKNDRERHRFELYLNAAKAANTNLQWLEPPVVDANALFKTTYAHNSAQQLANWNRLAPSIRDVRERTMNCSIKTIWVKPERILT